ncbi:hypothetical protein [Haloterrigena alkaliphila]|uniref:Uncharacterized protein n=1 Tax=Haloterrigena alkaliphila TaxID=2816475 RepID=A0A8A2VB90_9EURY|nr:hypothetical protein [Haloterrigena alkaliphila]QSW99319.1 hypothetical protein J0X25_18420 [Haloterrigena alkaliphila]
MTNGHDRRRFIQIAGTGAAASLAGCAQLDSLMQSDGDSSDAVTVAVAPDREEMQALNEEIQSEVENGNLSRQEAQQRMVSEQQNLTEAAATEFEESADGSDISIEDAETQYGLFRVTGSDEAIMSALRSGEISGIYPGDQYDAFVRRQEQQAQRRQMLQERQQQAEQQENGTETESGPGNETGDSDGGNETENSSDGNVTAE